jgi:hypothetical protein
MNYLKKIKNIIGIVKPIVEIINPRHKIPFFPLNTNNPVIASIINEIA